MEKGVIIAIFVVLMVATIVCVDVFIFKEHFWERLASNIGIVLLFGAFYLRFFNH